MLQGSGTSPDTSFASSSPLRESSSKESRNLFNPRLFWKASSRRALMSLFSFQGTDAVQRRDADAASTTLRPQAKEMNHRSFSFAGDAGKIALTPVRTREHTPEDRSRQELSSRRTLTRPSWGHGLKELSPGRLGTENVGPDRLPVKGFPQADEEKMHRGSRIQTVRVGPNGAEVRASSFPARTEPPVRDAALHAARPLPAHCCGTSKER